MILAGDIGGTKTSVSLFDDGLKPVDGTQRKYTSKNFPSLEAVLQTYRTEFGQSVTHAGFGIAGPVNHGVCKATNLPWEVHADAIAELLGVKSCGLVNDLVANARGIRALSADQFVSLNPHGLEDTRGHQVILSAGTGLGQGSLVFDGTKRIVCPSEGGHADFAPRTELESELRQYLTRLFGRASYERVLSGRGIDNIFRFFRDIVRLPCPAELNVAFEKEGAPAIAPAVTAGVAIAQRTLDLFCSIYGAQAGNLALNQFATGGVYVGGGIAPRIIDRLQAPAYANGLSHFMHAFFDKAPQDKLLARVPVWVILNSDTALLGAAAVARD